MSKGTHKLSHNPLYHMWWRLFSFKKSQMCERWHSVENFVEDLKDNRIPRLSLVRRDSLLPFSLDNCYWGKAKDTKKMVIVGGVSKNISRWADELGISKDAIYARLKRGYSIDKAFTVDKYKIGRTKREH